MDEPRDQPPPAVTRPPVITSGAARLSPLQEAWSRYVDHATSCDDCRHIGRGRCETSDRLYGEYQAHDEAGSGFIRP